MRTMKDLTGGVFGRLTAIEPAYNKDGRWYWRCSCDCGEEVIVLSSKLSNGNTKSCGCLSRDWIVMSDKVRAKYNGETRSGNSPYKSWDAMISRCYNPHNKDYHNYGGKGITVCDEWKTYGGFREWARAANWKQGLTIDRIDSTLGYTSTNCRWLPNAENARRAHKR
jgi:hypothetical protein